MNKQTKIIVYAIGGALLLAGLGFGAYHLAKNWQKDDATEDDWQDGDSTTGTTGKTDTDDSGGNPSIDSSGQVVPIYNAEKELDNDFSQLKGRVLFPKREWVGGQGYANVRTSPEVNTNQGWWDGQDNLITTINSGTPIGQVLSETTTKINEYPYRWFKVKLIEPVGFFFPYKEGYVRADTVTIKPYTP